MHDMQCVLEPCRTYNEVKDHAKELWPGLLPRCTACHPANKLGLAPTLGPPSSLAGSTTRHPASKLVLASTLRSTVALGLHWNFR
jgi:hypothetical protein